MMLCQLPIVGGAGVRLRPQARPGRQIDRQVDWKRHRFDSIDWIGKGENKDAVETTQQRLKRTDGMKENHQ